MPILNWNITYIDGKQFLVIDVAKFRIPLDWDPNSNMFIAVAAPDGGLGNFPALVKGDDGDPANIDTSIIFEALEPDDPTPDYASFSLIAPQVWQLSLGLHKGLKGDDGVMILDPDDYATVDNPKAPRRILQLTEDMTGFEYVAQKVGDMYWPASIANTPTGNAAYTLCPIGIPAQPSDWRPHINGQCVFTGTGADVRVDLLARLSRVGALNGETAGPVMGRGFGPIGINAAGIATVLSSGPPAGSADSYNRVAMGETATIYIRGERQAGADTFSTDDDTSIFSVEVRPIP